MICFGDVARHIIGKPVQQVLRSVTSANPVPADITKIVSRRFTFAVGLTQLSFYRQEKTFQVTSVVESLGQHDPAPAAQNGGGAHGGGAASPVTANSELTLPLANGSPPPLGDSTPTSNLAMSTRLTLKDQEPQDQKHSSARKRLTFGEDTDDISLTSSGEANCDKEDSLATSVIGSVEGKAAADPTEELLVPSKGGEKKRSRTPRGSAH